MKALKNIISIALIILLSILNYVSADEMSLKNEDLIVQAFKRTEADFYQLDLNFNGKIYEEYIGIDEIEKLGCDIIKELNITEIKKEIDSVHNDFGETSQMTIYGKDSTEALITIILYSFYDKYNDKGETNLVVDFVHDHSYKQFREISSKINGLYDNHNIKAEITCCIIGTFEGKLYSDVRIKKITEVLQIVNGSKIEGLFDDSLISVSAYSPDIDTFIFTGNKKMNLNIAMSYNEYEGKTYIWIGSPIIAIGY